MPTSNPRLLACPRSNFLHRLMLFAVLLASPVISRSLRAETIDFARDIRPILSENCSYCHGPDEQKREADLRLDTSEGAWSVIEKGDSEQSELMRRLVTEDHDELMPPADSNRSLSAHEIELIRQWINQGAPWEQHWSFRPLAAPENPQPPPNPQAPIRNPIDAFVQQALTDALEDSVQVF